MSRNNNSRSKNTVGFSRRGPRREQKRTMDYEARVTRNGVTANHLLNFSMPDRDSAAFHHQKKTKSLAPRTKMEYLHASYRFVIAPLEADAVVPTWNIESLTEWSSVEQVLLWYDVDNPQNCPICMDAFRAPKITKCGHIFCWPCILRYLSMTDKYWRRCPMCFDAVQKEHLRSVQLHQVQIPPQVGSDVTFQFLERPKSSMFPQPRVLPLTTAEGGTDTFHSKAAAFAERKRCRKLPSVDDADATYSRVLEATPEYIETLLYSELRDLQSMDAEFRSTDDVDSLPFVEEAIRNTSERLAKRGDQSLPSSHENDKRTAPAVIENMDENASDDVYSFYQIANGTYVILHPINMKCLLKEFSDDHLHKLHSECTINANNPLEAAWTSEAAISEPLQSNPYRLLPDQVHGRVLDIEHVIMDETAQKRYRFLSHLPRFCDFYICELDLTSQLSPSTLACFRKELKKRFKQRKQKLMVRQTTTPSSPILKSPAPPFSLDQDGETWPSLYEQAVAESPEECTRSHASDRVVAEAQSFARVTETFGSFPALGSAGANEARPLHTDEVMGFGSPSAWINPSTSPSAVAWGSTQGGKKKMAGKKGVSLFSTVQRRSYR